MKLLAIAILCLSAVLAEETKDSVLKTDHLDIVELARNDGATKSSESQRKRDSGYSYTRPDRFSSHIRGRIVTRYPSSQTIRPFNRYGPPKHSSPQFGKPSSQYAPQNQYSDTSDRYPQSTGSGSQENQFPSGPSVGQMQQEVPSPIRSYDFVEPSPIASQNNEPFNSNAASYLPPRNQKLPGYSTSLAFSPHQQRPAPTSIPQHQQPTQSFQTQNLLQAPPQQQPQISDAALFLAQNAQAISQLYETPAANFNYEPIQNFPVTDNFQNPDNQFQNFDANNPLNNVRSQGLQDSRGFTGRLPSYASGILNPQQNLQQIQSFEKDRLISQLQSALLTARIKAENHESTEPRYGHNNENGNYAQRQDFSTSLGIQANPSTGPQLDKPNRFASGQRPFGNVNPTFGATQPGTSTTTSGFPFTYGLSSTTPTQPPSTTTTTSSTTTLTPQRPLQGVVGDGSSQVGTSVSPSGTPPTYPFPQYGGFVPTLIGTGLVANYPSYGSVPSSIVPVQSAGSSPTHFGLPIPTIPTASQGSTGSSKPTFSPKPQEPSGQRPVHTFPLQPIQPINPIAATPVQSFFPVAPAVSQVHPVHSPATSGHPTYGVQTALINPLLLKPVKAVYPVYYYPNVYQIQKPASPTYPWSYAPSYAQTKPAQIW